jgi:hypothetical protein
LETKLEMAQENCQQVLQSILRVYTNLSVSRLQRTNIKQQRMGAASRKENVHQWQHDNEAASRAEERAHQQTRHAPLWERWPGCGHIERETLRTKENQRQKNPMRQNHETDGGGKI